MSTIEILVRKDLLLELRRRESVPAMTLFSLTVFVIFHFGLGRSSLSGDIAAGVLWVTLLFAALLGAHRLFATEHEQGGLDGFLLAPVDRADMMVAKVATLAAFLLAVEVVAVPAFALMLLGPPLGPVLFRLAAILLLADLGIATIATLASALAIHSSARELLIPLIALPLSIPILICAARATIPLLAASGGHAVELKWPGILGLYDVVFALVAYAVFDFLLED
jgi:heme exporter protein B